MDLVWDGGLFPFSRIVNGEIYGIFFPLSPPLHNALCFYGFVCGLAGLVSGDRRR